MTNGLHNIRPGDWSINYFNVKMFYNFFFFLKPNKYWVELGRCYVLSYQNSLVILSGKRFITSPFIIIRHHYNWQFIKTNVPVSYLCYRVKKKCSFECLTALNDRTLSNSVMIKFSFNSLLLGHVQFLSKHRQTNSFRKYIKS